MSMKCTCRHKLAQHSTELMPVPGHCHVLQGCKPAPGAEPQLLLSRPMLTRACRCEQGNFDFSSTLDSLRREMSSREEDHRAEIKHLTAQIEASLQLFQQQRQPTQSETDARLDRLTEAVQALSMRKESRHSDSGAKFEALERTIQGLKAPQGERSRRHSESEGR